MIWNWWETTKNLNKDTGQRLDESQRFQTGGLWLGESRSIFRRIFRRILKREGDEWKTKQMQWSLFQLLLKICFTLSLLGLLIKRLFCLLFLLLHLLLLLFLLLFIIRYTSLPFLLFSMFFFLLLLHLIYSLIPLCPLWLHPLPPPPSLSLSLSLKTFERISKNRPKFQKISKESRNCWHENLQ